MAWQDRSYYRDPGSRPSNPLMWLLTGSVSLGRWFGIEVNLHASFIVFIVITLLLPGTIGGFRNAATASALLFGIVLLHEFGHCFASRSVGGSPQQILMTPLGGLAFADAPHRPWATFVTVAGGPLVNVLICLVTAIALSFLSRSLYIPWRPHNIDLARAAGASSLVFYLWWIFLISWALLLFNLLPIFPLDGGQLLQSLLWVKFGYYKATLFASITGMIGGGLLGLYGLMNFSLLLMCIAFMGVQFCYYKYRELKANGPWAYEEQSLYSAAYENLDRPKKASARKLRAAKRQSDEVAREQEQIDAILSKVHQQGMQSLTWLERRALKKATERQRRRAGGA